jgi:hypothetical protein
MDCTSSSHRGWLTVTFVPMTAKASSAEARTGLVRCHLIINFSDFSVH